MLGRMVAEEVNERVIESSLREVGSTPRQAAACAWDLSAFGVAF
jgi:hypothetical protein